MNKARTRLLLVRHSAQLAEGRPQYTMVEDASYGRARLSLDTS